MSVLVFDFDGTVADTFPLLVDITYDITHARRLHPDKIEELRRVPLLKAVRSLGGHVWDIPFLLALTRRAMRPRMDEVPPFRGLVPVLKELHAGGHELYLLSSNRVDNMHRFLAQHELDEAFAGVYRCNIFRKSAALRSLAKRKQWAARHTYYIGNEAADIDAAVDARLLSVAVTWSGQNPEALRAAQPTELIDTPKELLTVVGKGA